ncbi:helix-turn-helix transcriptional regulator [Streptomyces sp. NPDC001795]|uniref:helix-turn-helix domain-containing protein n=1 Tax=Streptomyces sp. NPDC001795 TaxID=3154525 RepID=UPI00331B545B
MTARTGAAVGNDWLPDPESIQTRADLAHGLQALREGAGRSYGRAARAAGVSRSTANAMCRGQSLPREETLDRFVKALGADPAPWTKALRRIRRNEAGEVPPPASARPAADVIVELRPWVTYYDRDTYPQELLRNVPTEPEDGWPEGGDLAEFPALLGRLTSCHVRVQAVTCHRGIAVPVDSPERFWALVATDIVLRESGGRRFEGSRKWLVRQTEEIIGGQGAGQPGRLALIWRTLFEVLLQGEDPARCAWPPRQIVKDVADALNAKPLRLRRVMDWLFEVFPADDIVGDGLREAWEQYTATRFPGLSSADFGSFAPRLVPIAGGNLCPYPFQAMRLPLTERHLALLLGKAASADTGLPLPYLLGSQSEERGDTLGKFLRDLIGRCLVLTRSESDEDWVWAVPTAPEWLELSGCATDGRLYPWGTELPTPRHANLRYPGGPQAVKPVGLQSEGKSHTDVWDCCGNVHEVVVWRPRFLDQKAPALPDFRLAGASFRNRPENASCWTFRRFIPEPWLPSRQNVGLRLIKYRSTDAVLRTQALKDFHSMRQRPHGVESGTPD